MDLDNFVFTKQNDNYTLSLLDYLHLVQESSQHESIKKLIYHARKIDANGVQDISTPDIFIQAEHKVHVFNQADTPHEAAYSFTGAGNFLYYIAKYPTIDRVVTQMEFLRRMHDELHSTMGVDNPFLDNRTSSYKAVLKNVDGVIKLFHVLNYDTGFRAVFDQSFNIVDVYFRHPTLEKFITHPLEDKKVIFAFFNVYFRSSLLREQLHEQLGKSYETLTFEEIRDFLTIYRMVNI
jgi:hypothetical protein